MRFLSPDWLAAVDSVLSASPEVAAATATTSLRLHQVVTGGPDGDVSYLIAIAEGTTRLQVAAPDAEADVTMACDWPTAVGIATGTVAPHDAFTTGILRIGGNIDILRAQAPALAGLSGAFDAVRAQTTYA